MKTKLMKCAVMIALMLTACDSKDAVVVGAGDASEAKLDGGVPSTNNGTGKDIFPGLIGNGPTNADREAFCKGRGPSVVVPGETPVCAGKLAEKTFRYGLCTCQDVMLNGKLHTDSIDSNAGMSVANGGASVGINGTFSNPGESRIGGSLIVKGPMGSSASQEITGDLKVDGLLSSEGKVAVGRDAWINGFIAVTGELSVGRDLHSPSGKPLVDGARVGGNVITEPFTFSPPCDCEKPLDVTAIVNEARTNNHNALINLDPDRLALVSQPTILELPCGRYYLSGIRGAAPITIKITGRTAIYVGGSIEAASSLNVDVGPQGEVDLFAEGAVFAVSGSMRLGSSDRPAASRMYLGSTSIMNIEGSGELVANIYAPRAQLIAAVSKLQIYGSLFVRGVVGSNLSVRFDRAITGAGNDCDKEIAPPTKGGECKACGDCANYAACIDGVCGACRTDADCCSPLICQNGQCVVIVN
ncbi:MAG: hypothetical protein KA712_07690 [Myxococcales bacterium]|nr:hypothetical protein [Myxococcales bacterium]